MKKMFLISLFSLFAFISNAQILDSISSNNYYKNSLGFNTRLGGFSGLDYGINYNRFLSKKVAINSELSTYQGPIGFSGNTQHYRISLGIRRYFSNQQKGWYVALNLSHSHQYTKFSILDNSAKVIEFNNATFINAELGYSFIIKDRFVIEPYIQPLGFIIQSNHTNLKFLYPNIGVRAKLRF